MGGELTTGLDGGDCAGWLPPWQCWECHGESEDAQNFRSARGIQPRYIFPLLLTEDNFSALKFQLIVTVREIVVVFNYAARIGEAGRPGALIGVQGMTQRLQAARPLSAFTTKYSLQRNGFFGDSQRIPQSKANCGHSDARKLTTVSAEIRRELPVERLVYVSDPRHLANHRHCTCRLKSLLSRAAMQRANSQDLCPVIYNGHDHGEPFICGLSLHDSFSSIFNSRTVGCGTNGAREHATQRRHSRRRKNCS